MGINNIIEKETGKEYNDKIEYFFKELKRIENKYKDFFNSRPNKVLTSEHDELHSHYFFGNDSKGRIVFRIHDDSDLPPNIKSECLELFNRVLGGK